MAAVVLECGHPVTEIIEVDGEARCRACEAGNIIDGTAQADTTDATEKSGEQANEERHDEAVSGSEGATDSLPQPTHSVRGTEPGRRGCWAISKRSGGPCGSPAAHGGDYCAAHSGLGVSADPQRWAPLGQAARQQQLAATAHMRLLIGGNRPTSPRSILRHETNRNATRLAKRTLDAALSPDVDDVKAAHLALKLIEVAEPLNQAVLEVSASFDPEAIEAMSLDEALAAAKTLGLEIPAPTLPETATTG